MFGNYTELRPFRFWCQKVLPLVYDESLSYYEILCKVVHYINTLIKNTSEISNDLTQLEEYVNTYFDNLDVQNEIDNKLDEMASDGTLSSLLEKFMTNKTIAIEKKGRVLANGHTSPYFTLGNQCVLYADNYYFICGEVNSLFYLTKVNLMGEILSQINDTHGGHGNDMTYDGNYIYVATNSNTIAVYDTNLNYIKTISTDVITGIYRQ